MNRADAYDRLVAAGAPELPRDRFYRIRERDDGDVLVEIHERRPRGRSRRLAWAFVLSTRDGLLASVVDAARSAAEAIAEREDLDALKGDHHP